MGEEATTIKADVVEAREIRLLDRNGRVRARLVVSEQDHASLRIFGANDALIGALGENDAGEASLLVGDVEGPAYVTCSVNMDRSVNIQIVEDQIIRAELSVARAGSTKLALRADEKGPTIEALCEKDGTAKVSLLNAADPWCPSVSLRAGEGSGSLVLAEPREGESLALMCKDGRLVSVQSAQDVAVVSIRHNRLYEIKGQKAGQNE